MKEISPENTKHITNKHVICIITRKRDRLLYFYDKDKGKVTLTTDIDGGDGVTRETFFKSCETVLSLRKDAKDFAWFSTLSFTEAMNWLLKNGYIYK